MMLSKFRFIKNYCVFFGFWFLLMAVISTASKAQHQPEKRSQELVKGWELYNRGMFDFSESYFDDFAQNYPRHPLRETARFYRSLNRQQLDSVNADQFFEWFIDRYPQSRRTDSLLVELGSRHFTYKNYLKSNQHFERALEHEVDSALAARIYYWMAESSAEQEKFDQARIYFLTLANDYAQSPWAPNALYARGRLYLTQQEYQAATEAFELLKSRFPNHPVTRRVRTALGESYYQQGKYQKAVEAFKEYLPYLEGELKWKAIYLMAESYNYLDEYDRASTYYLQYINQQDDPERIRYAQYGLGWVYHKQQVYHWAADAFEKAADGEDELARKALYYKAVNEKMSGRYDLALKTFQTFGDNYKEGVFVEEAYYEWAITAYEMGRQTKAVEILLHVVRSDEEMSRPGDVYTLLGEAYFANREYTRALQAFEAAEQLTEVDESVKLQARFQKAWVQYRNQAFKQAQPIFREVYEADPDGDLAGEALFWSADCYYSYEDYGPASVEFQKFLNEFPGHKLQGAARYSLGWSHFKMRRYEKAIHPLKNFLNEYNPPPISLFPYDTDTQLRIADAYYAVSKYDSAITYYQKAIGAEPGGDYAMFQVANCYYRSQRTYEAVRTFRKMLRIYPYSRLSEQAQYNVAYIYFLMNNYDQAINEFKTVINKYPRTEWAARSQYNIGDAFYNANDYQKAIDAYRKVLEKHPRSDYIIDAVNGIQYAQLASGRQDSSAQILESFLQDHPQASTADRLRFRQANMKLQAGDYEGAISAFRQYLRITNNERRIPEAYYNLAEAYQQMDRNGKAREAYIAIVDEHPESRRADAALEMLGRMAMRNGNYQEAITHFQRIIDRNRRLIVEAHLGLGDARLALGQLEEARKQYQAVLDIDQNNTLGRIGIGKVKLQRNNFAEAEEIFKTVSENNTTQIGAQAQYLLGKTFQEQEQFNKAIEAYANVKILYEAFVDWVASALVRSAECYLALNNQSEAQNTLQRVLEQYPQTEASAEARSIMEKQF
mgnify:CR=1 FL=1